MPGDAPPEGVAVQAALRELCRLLWRERIALDRLADGLAGVSRELDETHTEIDEAGLYQAISALELHRAIAAREAAIELGLEGDPTLRQLVDAAPIGWADELASHRRALTDLTTEVTHLVRRPVVDVTERAADDANEFPGLGVRRFGIQRSLREFLG